MSSFAQQIYAWAHISSHDLHRCAHTRARRTYAFASAKMRARASWHYSTRAKTHMRMRLCVLVGANVCPPAHRHVCLRTRNTSKHAHLRARTNICAERKMTQNTHARAGMASACACLHAHTHVCTRTDIRPCAHMGPCAGKRTYTEPLLQQTHGSTHYVCARRNIHAHSQGHVLRAIARARKQMREYVLASLATICVCKLAHRRSCILARADMCVQGHDGPKKHACTHAGMPTRRHPLLARADTHVYADANARVLATHVRAHTHTHIQTKMEAQTHTHTHTDTHVRTKKCTYARTW